MRCFFMRNGHIAGVEELPTDLDDAAAVRMARELFGREKAKGAYDGFEVWRLARFIYRWTEDRNPERRTHD